MNEELITRIRALIAQLQIEREALNQGSRAYANNTKLANALADGLNKLTGTARASAGAITHLTTQYEKLFATLQAGENLRLRLGGGVRVQTSQLQAPWKADQELDAAIDQSIDPPKSPPKVFVTESDVSEEITKRTQALNQLQQLTERERDILQNRAANVTDGERKVINAKIKAIDAAEQVDRQQKDLLRKWIVDDDKRASAEAKKAAREEKQAQREQERLEKKKARLEAEAQFIKARSNLENTLPGGPAAAARLDRAASAVHPEFNRDSIQSISTEGASRITRVVYAFRDAEGVMNKASFTVDRFGSVLQDTQRRFQSFGVAVQKDILEVAKWSIAIAVVYGPLQKLGELTETMIRNQAALADVTVTLGNATQSVTEIFNAASEVAQATGENLDDVIEAYNLAYRATGAVADSSERFRQANQLLSDSLVLSKLSALDEAEAIDALAAALRQSGLELDKGQELLDKWVKVTRVANVDLATLAIGFSVVGDAAEAAGVGAEKLNAIIATIAETSTYSGREVANIARALISGFQSDNARKELNALGISLEKSSGEARDFLDIVAQIKDYSDRGIISDEQFNRLTLAIGGGTRRQAAVSSFINASGKINNIEAAQMDSEGEAASALAKKLDTVQTSITRLGNAFQQLAQALGENGGILDLFKGVVDLAGTLVTALAKLTEVAGKAGPAMYTALGAMWLLKNPSVKGQALGLVDSVASNLATKFYASQARGPQQRLDMFSGDSPALRGQMFAGRFKAQYLPWAGAIAGAGIPAASNFLSGDKMQAAGNVLGGAAGAAIGFSMGGPVGAAIGSTLGSTIAESFVNAAENFKPRFEQIFEDVFTPAIPEGKEDDKIPQIREAEDSAVSALKDLVGGKGLGVVFDAFRKDLYNLAGKLTGGEDFKEINETQSLLIAAFQQKQLGLISEEDYNAVIEKFQRAVVPSMEKMADAAEASGKYAGPTSAIRSDREEELKRLLAERKIGIAPYRRGMESLEGFSGLAGSFAEATGLQGEELQKMFEQLGTIVSKGNAESLDTALNLVQTLNEVNRALEITTSDAEFKDLMAQRQQLVADLQAQLVELNNQIASQITLTPKVDLTELSTDEVATVVSKAQELQAEYLQALVATGAATQEGVEAYVALLPALLLDLATGYEEVKGIAQEWLTKAVSDVQKETAAGLGFQTFDLTKAEYAALQPAYQQKKAELEAFGYKADETPMINILEDGMLNDRKDWKIVQLLLQDILETEQKQLEGMFNLPDGASFWIPYEAAKLFSQPKPEPSTTTPDVTAPGKVEELPTDVVKPVAREIIKEVVKVDEKPVKYQTTEEQLKAFRRMEEKFPVEPVAKYATTTDQMQAFREQEEKYPIAPVKEDSFLSVVVATLAKVVEFLGTSVTGSRVDAFVPEKAEPQEAISSSLIRQILAEEAAFRAANPDYKEPTVPSTPAAIPPDPSFWSKILGFMLDKGLYGPMTGQGLGATPTVATAPTRTLENTYQSPALTNLSTRLSLSIDNRTTINLDGRQIAAVVKQYLKDDLVRYSGTSASRTVSMI